MVFLNSRISLNPRTSPAFPLFSPKFSRATQKSPSILTTSNSRKLPLQRPFALYLLQPVPSTKFQISAHFRRPTTRQNYLRKKFTQQQRQLQQVTPVHEFDRIDESNFGTSGGESTSLEKRSSLDNELNFNLERRSSPDYSHGESISVKDSETESRKKKLGESIMWTKLESWIEQYKKDSEFWGIGTGPIFTIFQDSEGKTERVVVNEDEILKRSRVDPQLDRETEEFAEVNYKISFAKDLATEMKNGSNVIPKNSSVAKFVVSGNKSSFTDVIRSPTWKPVSLSRIPKVGVGIFCALLMLWSVKGLFSNGNNNKEEYTRLEKEMLRRKIKARAEKEKVVKGSVEVMPAPIEPKSVPFARPQLDKEVLLSKIITARESNSEPGMVGNSDNQNKEFMEKIEEIRAMARHAREIEKRDSAVDDDDGVDDQDLEGFSSDSENQENDLPTSNEIYDVNSDGITESSSSAAADPNNNIGQDIDEVLWEEKEKHSRDIPNIVILPNGYESSGPEAIDTNLVQKSSSLNEDSDGPESQHCPHEKKSLRKNFKIIKSAKEAREYLARKHHSQEPEIKNNELNDVAITRPGENLAEQILDVDAEVDKSSSLSARLDSSYSPEDSNQDNFTAGDTDNSEFLNNSGPEVNVSNPDNGRLIFNISGEEETGGKESQEHDSTDEIASFLRTPPNSTSAKVDRGSLIETEARSIPVDKHNSEDNERFTSRQNPGTVPTGEVNDRSTEIPAANKDKWIEKNFHEIEPIIEKISAGFRDNYLQGREKAKLDSNIELMQLQSDGDASELEWMKDERLAEIVFKVRDNELSGREPFHLMTEEDKSTFFSGLEKKIEQENEKLQKLHEYFHANIENLDYGADGISMYDPPEKIIPRWKNPPAEKNPEFLNNFVEQRKTAAAEGLKNSFLAKKTGKVTGETFASVASNASNKSQKPQENPKISSKTIIEGSDGSVRAGKKSGTEYWEHTKKWSQGFLESYNAENDPEVKSVMKDIGKDLNRWITEKEIQEAADLMNKIPEKGQKIVKEKLDKVKREMELFGPQAVVSKYREYADEKEEDYLWWLDLSCVLCIELYTVENGEQRMGFYSLEMAPDLELEPKQYHVVAFEDAGDCKNLCYIIQAQMEVLGNGNAFVVARPPKDAFREAKENGFSVTVIRKGQLKLNVDQTLEDVEELIVEIGSKIYHDKIMKERSVDINGLMKGVFGVSKPAKRRRSKRKSKRRAKQ